MRHSGKQIWALLINRPQHACPRSGQHVIFPQCVYDYKFLPCITLICPSSISNPRISFDLENKINLLCGIQLFRSLSNFHKCGQAHLGPSLDKRHKWEHLSLGQANLGSEEFKILGCLDGWIMTRSQGWLKLWSRTRISEPLNLLACKTLWNLQSVQYTWLSKTSV